MFLTIKDISTGVEIEEPLNVYSINYIYLKEEKGKKKLIYVLINGLRKIEAFDTDQEVEERLNEINNVSVGGLVQVDSYGDLPPKGSKGSIYITKDTGQTYYWDVRTETYVTTGTAGRTGVYSYAGDLSTVIGTDTVLNQSDLSALVEPTVPFSEGSEVVAGNSVHGMIISRTSTTVTVKTITDMTIDSFQQVNSLSDLPTTGFENILYAVKDIDEFRAWDSVNSEWYAPAMVYTGVNNTQIHVSVNADREIEAELQDGSVAKTHLTQALQDDLDSLTVLPTYNSTTHKITFTTLGGNTYEIDLPMEDAVDSVTYDPSTKKITVHKFSGTVNYIDLSDLANYVAGNGIEIDNKTIKIKLDSSNSNGLVSTASGLGLNTVTESSSGAMTAADKIKLNGLENYDDTQIKADIANKVDKVAGKGLSTNDFTDADKTKLDGLENYDDTNVRNLIDLKVDKVTGKGLSTNDFTNADKTKLDSLENYDDTQIKADLANKVDKVTGKGLSTEDFTTALKTKLENLDPNGEENVIEIVKVDGTALTPDANKAVNITLPAYTLVKNEARPGYASTYNLKKDGVIIGDTIEIPENSIIKGGSIGVVDTPDVPYPGAKVGDKYLDLELETTPASHVYVPLKDLIVGYTGGDGIDISAANEIRAQIDPNLANGLQVTSTGIGLNLATTGRAGAMSNTDKYKLDGLSNYDDTAILAALDNKVDKVAGKGLSTNDFTNDEKSKLSGIERNAQVNVIETVKVNGSTVGPTNKTISLNIPNKTSDLVNDLNFVSDANYTHTDNNFTDSEKNKLSSLSNYDDSNLRNEINSKQDELVSGTNIKTINNQSLLGSGNIEINSECKLTSTLTANQTVGGVDAGDTFAVGTTLEYIIRKILYKEGGPTPVTNYTVSFNTYGGSSVASQIVEDGQKATRPATDPTKSGFTFDNWYTTSAFDTLFNFNNVIESDTVVHAKWDAIPLPEYLVEFNTYGGSEVADQTVTEGSKVTRPTNPTKANFTFDDWYTNSTYETKYNFNNAVMADMVLHAKWNPVTVYHTVTYYDTDGSVLTTQQVEDNTRTTKPTNPTKSGYTFDNWYSDQALTTLFNFNSYIVADTPVYAKWIENPQPDNYDLYIGGFSNAECSNKALFAAKTAEELLANVTETHMADETPQPFVTITTYGDGNLNSIFYVMVKDGVNITQISKKIEGYDPEVFTPEEIADPDIWKAVHTDITIAGDTYHIYGLRNKFNNDDTMRTWITPPTPVVNYTVTFNTHGGSSIADQTVVSGSTATRPADPTRSGYTFDNWYVTDAYMNVFDFTTPITENTEIHAKWDEIPVTHTVSFDTHGGSSVADQTVNDGGNATRPTDSTRSGYVFDDWYTDTTWTTTFDFANTPITANTTIHANWTAEPGPTTYTVSFDTAGGSSVPSQTVNAGSTATRPATDPTKSGYTFDDWYTDGLYATKFDFTSPINVDTVVYGKFDIIPVVTHTVTFYDGATVLSTETVNDGGNATRPATDPTKTGYIFDNWYPDMTYTTPFDFTSSITADTPIYANFTPDTPTTGKDIYIGSFTNTECSSATIFANKTQAELLANVMDSYEISDTQPFTHISTWGDETGAKNSIYYIIVKDGVHPTVSKQVTGQDPETFPESEITDPTIWKAVHTDLTIDGDTYHVYGLRNRYYLDDTMKAWIA